MLGLILDREKKIMGWQNILLPVSKVRSLILLLMCQPKSISYALLAGSSSEQPTNTEIWLSGCHIFLKKTEIGHVCWTRFYSLVSLRCLLNLAIIRSANTEVSEKNFNAIIKLVYVSDTEYMRKRMKKITKNRTKRAIIHAEYKDTDLSNWFPSCRALLSDKIYRWHWH